MNMRLGWIPLAGLLVSLWVAHPAAAQEADAGRDTGADAGTVSDTDAGTGTVSDAGTDAFSDADSDAEADQPREGASEAERILRIRRGIKLDQQKLRGLRIEERVRLKWFEDLAEGMTEVSTKLNEEKEALEKLGVGGDPDETTTLKRRIVEFEEDYELYNRQTDLALTVERKLKEQLDALGHKIETEKHSLAELTGEVPIARPAPTVKPVSAPVVGATERATPVPGMPLGMPPGMPPIPTSKPPQDGPSATTAAQLRAQKVVEQKTKDLERARFEVENYVERKRALETQIEFEDTLTKAEADEIENLQLALITWQKRLDTATETGDDARTKRTTRAVVNLAAYIEKAKKGTARRAEYRASLQKRLGFIEEEGLRVNSVADEKHEALEKAQRSLFWLESPVHPQNIAHWAIERGPRIFLVIAMIGFLMILLQVSARRVARTFLGRGRGARSLGNARADTLAFSFRSAARVILMAIGILLVLQEAGLDIRTVLGGAAIFGVAIAFGAQDLMRDYFTGFLILLEDQYQLGDLVTIEGITGTVESVNMRVTVLRDLEGRVHFIPNGNIKAVTNRTYGWGRPVFEIPVRYDEDVDRVMETLVEVATGLMTDPDWKPFVTGEPEMLGVDKFTDRGIIIKFMVKTQPDKLFAVRREMLRRISKRFNELGIQITVPQRLIMHGQTDTDA